MGRSQETFNKKENEKKRIKKKKEKMEKREERKANYKKGKSLEEMMAYIDEDGNISATPPDPSKKRIFKEEDIVIGVYKKPVEEESNEPRSGVISFFNDAKGYGFIKDLKTGESVFVHVNGLRNPVKENDKVTFKVEMGMKGMNAVEVTLAVPDPATNKS